MGIFLLLLVALVVAFGQSLLFGKWALSRVKYTRQFSVTECYSGDTIEMIEVIENRKLMPVFWLRAESTIAASLRFHSTEETMDIDVGKRTQYHKSLFSIGSYRRIRRTHKVICARRGLYRIDQVSLTAGDLLGMNDKSKSMPVNIELIVYPQVVTMEEIPLPSHGWQGDVSVRRWIVEDPFLMTGVRDYRSGDPMKRIHWKATARTGTLQVYQHDYTAEQRLVVYLNVMDKETTRDVVHDEKLIEKGISYAATIVSDAVARGIPVGFGHNGMRQGKPEIDVRLPIGGGREHLLAILSEMAAIELRCKLLFHDFLAQDDPITEDRCDYLLITSHVSQLAAEQIERLKQAGHSVQTLLVEKDYESEVAAG